MPLIIEDGTARADAESYASVAYADAYFSSRAVTAWTGTNDQKEALLRKATDFMGQVYRGAWSGRRKTETQALDWPREGVPRLDYGGLYASDAIPAEIVRACCELALRAVTNGALYSDQTQAISEQTVGPITTKYAGGSSAVKRYSAVDALLRPFLGGAGAMGASVGLVRT
jgi:hypothetical protein